jgi:YidC/Oxa1 family membrane protein insertase
LDKRLLIALPLCLLILFGYNYFFGPKPRPPGTGNTAPGTAAAADARPAEPEPGGAETADELPETLPRVAEREERTLEVFRGDRNAPEKPGTFRAVFTNKGAGLVELRTGQYYDRAGLSDEEKKDWRHWVPLVGNPDENATQRPISFELRTLQNSAALATAPLETELWQMQLLGDAADPRGVEFTLAPGTGVTFVKRFLFVPGQNRLVVELELANDSLQQSGPKTFELVPAGWVSADSGDSYYPEPQAVAGARTSSGIEVESIPRDPSAEELRGSLSGTRSIAFVGVHSKYFALLMLPQASSPSAIVGASWRRVRDEDWAKLHAGEPLRQIVADAQFELPLPAVGQRSKVAFDVYAGPKDPDALAAAHPDLRALHDWDLGWVRVIAAPLLFLLNVFHALCSSWGVAIILLTLLVRLVLFPINRRSQTAMSRYAAKMKRLQPKIDELKKRFERDPSKLRAEQARLMQQEGAFPPLGGCLPLFLQIPVFIGLYRALGISFDLRQASFMGWIPDLALPDRLLRIDLPLPFFGTIEYLNILPPLMVGLWIWQQKMMPMPADEQAARMQKMMMFMPVMMGVFLYNYAAGLSLYMITQSALGIFETKVIRKYWPVDDKEQPKKQTGFWSKMIALQEQAERQRRGTGKRA